MSKNEMIPATNYTALKDFNLAEAMASEMNGMDVSFDILVSCDFSQIELRVGAFYCRDPKMLETYRTDGDIHAATTSVIFGIPYAQAVDKNAPDYKERRTIAKNVNFGVFYGLFPRGLQRTPRFKAGLNKSLSDCEGILQERSAGLHE